MDELERIEREADQAAREDYLREAYGSEAAMLAQIDADEAEWEYKTWLEGLTPEQRAEHEVALARRDEAESHGIDMDDDPDDVPF